MDSTIVCRGHEHLAARELLDVYATTGSAGHSEGTEGYD